MIGVYKAEKITSEQRIKNNNLLKREEEKLIKSMVAHDKY